MKNILIGLSLFLLLLLASCQPSTVTYKGGEGSTIKVSGSSHDWCAAGATVDINSQQGQLASKVIGKETITIGSTSVETCHSISELGGVGGAGTVESWASQDGKSSKTVYNVNGEKSITESWENNGKHCIKTAIEGQPEGAYEQCG